MFLLFLHAQYKAKMAPLINEITRTAKATPDIHVVAQVPTAGSVLFSNEKKNYLFISMKMSIYRNENVLWRSGDKGRIHVQSS